MLRQSTTDTYDATVVIWFYCCATLLHAIKADEIPQIEQSRVQGQPAAWKIHLQLQRVFRFSYYRCATSPRQLAVSHLKLDTER